MIDAINLLLLLIAIGLITILLFKTSRSAPRSPGKVVVDTCAR